MPKPTSPYRSSRLAHLRRICSGKASRVLVAALSLSGAGLVALVGHEAYVGQAMIPTKGDRPTLGFGSTTREDGTPVRMGDTTTPERALKRTLAYIQADEADMRRTLDGVALYQAEYDLYLNWRYQYGATAWAKSSMLRELRAGNYVAACDALLEYRKMTSARQEGPDWVPSQRDAAGKVLRWEFDCSTPGNRVCRGVWTRQQERHAQCMAAQQP